LANDARCHAQTIAQCPRQTGDALPRASTPAICACTVREAGVVAVALADLAERAGQHERHVGRSALRSFEKQRRVGGRPGGQHP
jgi:hypothetical protein